MLEVRYIYDVDYQPVDEYTLKNGRYQISILNLGAAITKLVVTNKYDKLENIILRYHNYKYYKTNPYLIGGLVDIDKLMKQIPCIINYYFTCQVLENGLKFIYEKENFYIYITYTLLDNKLIIDYDTNLSVNLGHVIFYNLSGNIKDNILHHELLLNSQKIDFKQNIPYFIPIKTSEKEALLQLQLESNGIQMNVECNSNIYISNGTYFVDEFPVNRGVLAQAFSGLGIVCCGKKQVSYTFNNI